MMSQGIPQPRLWSVGEDLLAAGGWFAAALGLEWAVMEANRFAAGPGADATLGGVAVQAMDLTFQGMAPHRAKQIAWLLDFTLAAAFVVSAQWGVLFWRLRVAGWWIPVVFAAAVGVAVARTAAFEFMIEMSQHLGMGSGGSAAWAVRSAVIGLVSGAFIAFVQWTFLHGRLRHAVWWVVAGGVISAAMAILHSGLLAAFDRPVPYAAIDAVRELAFASVLFGLLRAAAPARH